MFPAYHTISIGRHLFLLLLLSGISPGAMAGLSQNADSLLNLVKTDEVDSIELNTYSQLALEYSTANFDSALIFFEKAIAMSKASGNRYAGRKAYERLGNAFIKQQDYTRALEAYHMALNMSENEERPRAVAINMGFIGFLHFQMENYDEALRYYQDAYKLCQEGQYAGNLMRQTNNIGTVYLKREQPDSAVVYFEQGLLLANQLKHDQAISFIGVNIANCYAYLDEFDKGREVLERSLGYIQNLGDRSVLAQAFGNVGSWYQQQANGSVNEPVGQTRLFKQRLAIKYYKRAAAIHDSLKNYYLLKQWYYGLSQGYEVMKEADSALLYQKLYKSAHDSVFELEKAQLVAGLESTRKVAIQKQHIKLLQKENELRRLWQYGLILFAGLLIIIALLLYFYLRAGKRSARIEREAAKHKREQLEENLNLRNRQLTSHALQILQKNNLMEELKSDITLLRRSAGPDQSKELGQFINRLSQGLQLDQDWDKFRLYFEEVHPGFFETLNNVSGGLTTNELRHAAMVRLGMSLKESASILNVAPPSVKIARNRLKKKLNLAADDDLTTYVRAI